MKRRGRRAGRVRPRKFKRRGRRVVKHAKMGTSFRNKRFLSNVRALMFGSQVWPDKFETVMTTAVSTLVAAGTGATQLTYLANSFGDGTAATNGCGPQVNLSGAFNKNYPSGLKGLIQAPAAAGTSICPYQSYYIPYARLYYRVIPSALGGSLAPASEMRVIAFPSDQLSYAATPLTALEEQNGAKVTIVAPGYFGTATTTAATGGGQPLASNPQGWQHIDCDIARVKGLSYKSFDINQNFVNDYGHSCNNQVYFQLFVAGDGTANYACDVEVVLKYRTIFIERNQNLSTAQNN